MASGELEIPLLIDSGHPGGVRAAVAEALRRAVLAGAYRSGDPIPSSRVLAARLGVSRGSVVAAVDQLAGEGYLVAHDRAGVVVAAHASPAADSAAGTDARRAASPPTVFEPEPRTGQIDLRPGRPDARALASPEWRAAWRAAVASDPPDRPADPRGLLALRVEIAAQLRHSRGVSVSPDDVVVTSGTAEAVALLVRARAQADGRVPHVVVEDPGYPAVRRRLRLDGARVSGVPVIGDGLRVDDVAAAGPDVVVVTPSHQYPTGGRLAVDLRLALVALAQSSGVLVIEDDYDSEFRYVGAPLPALASLEHGGRVAHVGSFSKTVSPWLRIAFAVVTGEAPLRPTVDRLLADSPPTPSGPTQAALAHYMASGALRRHLARMRRAYAHRRTLVQSFGDSLGGGRVGGLDGGLHATVTLAEGVDAGAVVRRLADAGVLLASLDDYALSGRATAPALVLGYGSAGDLELSRGLAVVQRVLGGVARGIQEP